MSHSSIARERKREGEREREGGGGEGEREGERRKIPMAIHGKSFFFPCKDGCIGLTGERWQR